MIYDQGGVEVRSPSSETKIAVSEIQALSISPDAPWTNNTNPNISYDTTKAPKDCSNWYELWQGTKDAIGSVGSAVGGFAKGFGEGTVDLGKGLWDSVVLSVKLDPMRLQLDLG